MLNIEVIFCCKAKLMWLNSLLTMTMCLIEHLRMTIFHVSDIRLVQMLAVVLNALWWIVLD